MGGTGKRITRRMPHSRGTLALMISYESRIASLPVGIRWWRSMQETRTRTAP